MKKLNFIITVILILGFQLATEAQNNETSIWVTIQEDIIHTISFEKQLSSSNQELESYIEQFSIKSVSQALPSSKNNELLDVYEVVCLCDQSEFIEAINNRNTVLMKAEPAPVYVPLYIPNDYNMTFQNDYALDLINAQGAWAQTTGDSSVIIAISDTNFDLAHEELTGTVAAKDPYFFNSNSYHGTAVAITAAVNTDNQLGKSSIGANCSLELRNMGYNSILTATYSGAEIINVSWAGSCSNSAYQQEVIDEAYNNGSIIVAAAGNGSTCGGAGNHVYPASLNHVISVSSIGPENNHERTIGDPSTTHQHNNMVDVLAPGYDVALTVSSGWYLTGNGSSFAAPYVSGLVGLIKSVNPCLNYEQVELILKMTAYNVDSINPSYDGKLGAGRIDASAAVQFALNFGNQPDFELSSALLCSTGEVSMNVFDYDIAGINTINWSNGVIGENVVFTNSGKYSVTVVDTLGCVGTSTFNVEVSSELGTQIKTSEITCFNSQDGAIEVGVFGGVAPYTYLWEDNSNENTLEDLGAGIYGLTIQDANDCIFNTEIELIAAEEIIIEGVVSCDELGNGEGAIDLDITGGYGNLTCNWSNGSIVEDLENLTAGGYIVQVSDENNCISEMTFDVSGEFTSLSDLSHSTINLYPNPSSGQMVMITGQVESYQIYNSSGQLVSNVENEELIDISAFGSGIYVVVINTKSGAESKKLTVL